MRLARLISPLFIGIFLALRAAGAEPLESQVRAVFERSCADCHGPNVKKPKGKFGHVLDLQRLRSEPDYVVLGQPEKSELYNVLIDSDPDYRMPPPDSDAPALTPEEIALVHAWILQPEKEPEKTPTITPDLPNEKTPPPAQPPIEATATTTEKAKGWTLKKVTARLHPLVVHFPIALLLVALLSELCALRRGQFFPEVTRWCIVLAVLSGLAAGLSGWLLAPIQGYSDATVFSHRWPGIAVVVLTTLTWLTSLSPATASNRRKWIARVLLLLAAGLVSAVGHTGGVLVHGADYLPF